jgi:hypothetical protein
MQLKITLKPRTLIKSRIFYPQSQVFASLFFVLILYNFNRNVKMH